MEQEKRISVKYVKNSTSKDTRDMIPLEFENHMLQILGTRAQDLPNHIEDFELREAKNLFLRYFDVLKRTYIANIKATNSFLMNQIEDIILITQSDIRAAKSMSALCLLTISTLGELNFRTLGGMLDNIPRSNKRTRIRNQDLELNRHYSIHYSQSISQRANLICDHIQNNMPELYEKIRKMRVQLKCDEKFIKWIKSDENYSKIYLELF